MTTNQFFLEATDYFYKNDYQKGLDKIDKCLQLHPNNSTLLANRALFFSQMGHLQKAIEQLQYCIKLDYQNYIPYFNLFSLKVRKNQLDQALKDLSCSLSCLYLTRARFRKRDQDAKQSIKYAKNNIQAHVLRAMIYLQAKKLKQCINELNWAYQFDPNLPTLNKIRSIVQNKLGINETPRQNDGINVPRVQRLCSSYQPVQQDFMMEIKMKMTEFNSVYNDLNQQNGIVTHRVPRTLLPQQIQKLLTDNNLKEQIQQIYELKYNAENTNQPVIYQMKEEYRVQNQIQFQQRLKQEDEDQIDSGVFSQNDVEQQLNNSSLMDHVDHQDQQQISKIAENSKQQILSDIQKPEHSNIEQQLSQGSFNQYLVVDEYPEFPPVDEQSQSQIQPSLSIATQDKYNSQYVESSVSSFDIQQPSNLYPMTKKVYGRFKIQKFEIQNEKYITNFFENEAQQSQILTNRQMYCVCTYFKQKPGYKVTTCDRGLFFNSDSRRLECQWSETFKQVLLTNEAQNIFTKIYAKNTNSYNDDLIGMGSKIVDVSGQIIVAISSAKDSNQRLGELHVRLFLMDK